MPILLSSRTVRAPDVEFRRDGEVAVLLKNQVFMGLDAIGTQMWTVLTEATSIQQAFEVLLDEYDVNAEQLRCHLLEFIGELEQNGLIEIWHDDQPIR